MAAAQLTLLLLLSMALHISAAATCEFPIRRSSVLSSWQPSFYEDTCFYSRNQTYEAAVVNNQSHSYRLFHSNGSSYADRAFQWFAVQLNEPVLISSVTVKAREDGRVLHRAIEIEIWTSNSSRAIFSGDHCRAQNMGREFRESADSWRLCGVTKSRGENVTSGEIFTVSCVAEVRHLLLRRNVSLDDGYMSFADLRLQTVQLTSSAPRFVAQNSSFTVSCSLHCNGSQLSTNSTPMQLCFPNGSCSSQHKMKIDRARPQDAGHFTCRLGSVEHRTAVTVLSSSAPPVVAQNSSFTVSCSLHCPGSEVCAGPRHQMQLCFPNGSCTGQHKMKIDSARPLDAGIYACKIDGAEHRTAVTVLSSSAKELVAQNSSFTVSCSLHHCSGSQLSTDSTPMQLCFPNGSCSSQHKMKIDSARPQDAGNFICRLGSVEHRTAVTVLYPPSHVSISVAKKSNCRVPSGLKVMFKSTASNPAAEHRCRAELSGCRVQNLTVMSQNTSGDASVSLWTLDVDEEWKLEWSHGFIECRAVQNLPAGMKFESELSDRARWSCMDEAESGISPIVLVFTAGIGCASAIIFIIQCVLTLRGIIKWNLQQPRCPCFHAVAMPESHDAEEVAMVRRCSKTEDAALTLAPGTVADSTEYDNANSDLGINCGVYVLQ